MVRQIDWITGENSLGSWMRETSDLEGKSPNATLIWFQGTENEDQITIDVYMHRILGDEWSEKILKEDFAKVYQDPSVKPECQMQMWEFAEWELSLIHI